MQNVCNITIKSIHLSRLLKLFLENDSNKDFMYKNVWN